jgi:hypothetical protein
MVMKLSADHEIEAQRANLTQLSDPSVTRRYPTHAA